MRCLSRQQPFQFFTSMSFHSSFEKTYLLIRGYHKSFLLSLLPLFGFEQRVYLGSSHMKVAIKRSNVGLFYSSVFLHRFEFQSVVDRTETNVALPTANDQNTSACLKYRITTVLTIDLAVCPTKSMLHKRPFTVFDLSLTPKGHSSSSKPSLSSLVPESEKIPRHSVVDSERWQRHRSTSTVVQPSCSIRIWRSIKISSSQEMTQLAKSSSTWATNSIVSRNAQHVLFCLGWSTRGKLRNLFGQPWYSQLWCERFRWRLFRPIHLGCEAFGCLS